MLDFICPRCGASVDVAADQCPQCGAPQRPEAADSLDPDETVAIPASSVSQPGRGAVPPVAAVESEMQANADPAPPAASQASPKRRASLHVRPWHSGLFAGLLAGAILAAVILSDGIDGLRLETPDEGEVSRVEAFGIGVLGPVEVSGIRPYYDDNYQAHVRAYVTNHSRDETSVAFVALLRVREASEQAPPLATFDVVISNPLPPNGGMEIDVPLQAMGTLQSLPPWHEMRVDLEVLGAGTE